MDVDMNTLALKQGEQCQVCALPGMLETRQRKSRTRRKRKELLLGQMCFMGCLMLLASAISHWAGILGEFFFCIAITWCPAAARVDIEQSWMLWNRGIDHIFASGGSEIVAFLFAQLHR